MATVNSGNYILQTSTGYLSILDSKYNSTNHSYDEITESESSALSDYSFDISYLTQEVTVGDDTFIPLDKIAVPFKIINTNSKNFNTNIKGLKSNTELIVANNDFDVTRISDIDNFTVEGGNTNNGNMQVVFSIDSGNTWKTYEQREADVVLPTRPTSIPTNISVNVAAYHDNFIYCFGDTYAYKYNIVDSTYTILESPPYEIYSTAGCYLDGYIYLFGSMNINNKSLCKYAYKYDISNDSYTRLSNIPVEFVQGRAITDGTNIYLLNFINSSYSPNNTVYKYFVKENIYSNGIINAMPIMMPNSIAAYYNNCIYSIGAELVNNKDVICAYKYDFTTKNWTELSTPPENFQWYSMEIVDNKGYIYYDNKLYEYDFEKDRYTYKIDLPINSKRNNANNILYADKYFYILGNYGALYKIDSTLESKVTDILNINVPLKMQDQLTTEEQSELDTAKTAIKLVGIPYNELSSIDFNSIDISHLRFAYLFDRPTIDDTVYTNLLKWQFDAYGQMFALDEESDYGMDIGNGKMKMKINNDFSMIKINYMNR